MKRLLEWIWLAAFIIILGFGLRSFILAHYESQWESWRELPWARKCQPIVLAAKSFFYNRFPPRINNRAYAQTDALALRRSVQESADWLLSVQEPSGHFKYWYDPVSNQFSPSSDDSFHRQAGAGYGLALAYRMTGDRRYLEGARQSVWYLLRYKKEVNSDKSYFLFNNRADLGGASIPMFTMLEIRELTGTPEYDGLLRRLANFILFLQGKYGTGQFKSTYYYDGNYELEKKLGWESDLYPGEAMLALAGMYDGFKESRYRDSLDRALHFYSDSGYSKHRAFLPWTIMAFTSLYRQTGEKRYADYVLHLADYLLTDQNLDERDEVFGSFHAFPSISTASYLEGLADAIQLVKALGDMRREKLYVQRALIGFRWILSLQYKPDEIKQYEVSHRSSGGFRGSLTDPCIRIDYNGHAISALTRAMRHVFQQRPAVERNASLDKAAPLTVQ